MGSLFYTVGIPLCQYKIFLCNRFSPHKWDETVINTHLQKKTKRKCRNTYTNTRWRTVPLCRDEIWLLRVIVRCEICPGWRVEILSGKPGSCNHHLTAQKVDGDATCLNKLLTEVENRLLYFLASQNGSYMKIHRMRHSSNWRRSKKFTIYRWLYISWNFLWANVRRSMQQYCYLTKLILIRLKI